VKTLQPDQPIDADNGGQAVAKAALRQAILARRSALAPEAVAAAVRNELDAGPIARQALAQGKRLLLPRCRDGAPGLVDLGCVGCLSEAVPGSYGILEPPREACRPPEAFSPDLILVPGLAFDRRGNRLGFGGGYYDRLLALPMAQKAFTAGLGYDFQLVPTLPADPWDQPVNAVVTDRQTLLTTP
jgi:5-formyltetrahydrofolate cyclo-ligase